MIRQKLKRMIALLAAALVMSAVSGCGGKPEEKQSGGNSSSESSQAETQAPVKVTLPPKTTVSGAEADSDTSDGTEPEQPLYGEDIPYTPALWKATSPDGKEMYMMGSMHMLNDTCYPLPEEIMNAYNSADVLAVECDITALTASAAQLKYSGILKYPQGETVKDHLSAETWEKLSGYLELFDVDVVDAEKNRAWTLYSSVQNLALEDTTLTADKGLDRFLLTKARGDGKQIYEIESVDEQLEMLAGFSDNIYELLLSEYSVENAEKLKEDNKALFKAWKTGDLEWVEKESEGEFEDIPDDLRAEITDFMDTMYYDRNAHMVKDAKELMNSDKRTFMVVGLAHYAGKRGIIALLENDGYEVERIEIKAE